jgi:hypothetical protein
MWPSWGSLFSLGRERLACAPDELIAASVSGPGQLTPRGQTILPTRFDPIDNSEQRLEKSRPLPLDDCDGLAKRNRGERGRSSGVGVRRGCVALDLLGAVRGVTVYAELAGSVDAVPGDRSLTPAARCPRCAAQSSRQRPPKHHRRESRPHLRRGLRPGEPRSIWAPRRVREVGAQFPNPTRGGFPVPS